MAHLVDLDLLFLPRNAVHQTRCSAFFECSWKGIFSYTFSHSSREPTVPNQPTRNPEQRNPDARRRGNLSNVVIWAPGKPQEFPAQVRKALENVAPDLVVDSIQPYSEIIHADFAQQNMIASLTWLFGAIGLVLAAVGFYGVTAYGVEQRTNEIGVRMALGAHRSSVVRMVLREAFWQVGIGLALGIPSAISAGYLIASHLFGVRPWDPLLLLLATLFLGVAALIAAGIPAHRATRVEPVIALRYE